MEPYPVILRADLGWKLETILSRNGARRTAGGSTKGAGSLCRHQPLTCGHLSNRGHTPLLSLPVFSSPNCPLSPSTRGYLNILTTLRPSPFTTLANFSTEHLSGSSWVSPPGTLKNMSQGSLITVILTGAPRKLRDFVQGIKA